MQAETPELGLELGGGDGCSQGVSARGVIVRGRLCSISKLYVSNHFFAAISWTVQFVCCRVIT